MAVDVGTVRVGLAASDPDGTMAFPAGTIQRDADAVAQVAAVIADRGATQVFVGLPKTLAGGESASAVDARTFAQELAERTAAVVRLVDERFSTSTAVVAMRAAGRTAKQQRAVIDQAAAVVILEGALDVDRHGNLSKVTVEVKRKGSHDGSV